MDPGTLAINLWVPNSFNSLPFFFFFLASKDNFLQNAASGNVYLVVAVTTNCMAAHGAGSLTLILQTRELPRKKIFLNGMEGPRRKPAVYREVL